LSWPPARRNRDKRQRCGTQWGVFFYRRFCS